MANLYDYEVSKDGKPTTLKEYQGKVLLIVNTASKCGFTSQYEGLEKLRRDYHEKGFEVLAFPCNQFGGQEPGTDEEIQQFCATRFSVSFPVFSKVDVNGDSAHPLFEHLKSGAKGILGTSAIKWNFTKFLVDREGKVLYRYAPNDTPASLAKAVESVLETGHL